MRWVGLGLRVRVGSYMGNERGGKGVRGGGEVGGGDEWRFFLGD